MAAKLPLYRSQAEEFLAQVYPLSLRAAVQDLLDRDFPDPANPPTDHLQVLLRLGRAIEARRESAAHDGSGV